MNSDGGMNTTRKLVVWNCLVWAAMIAIFMICRQLRKQGAIGGDWGIYWFLAMGLTTVVTNGVLSFGLQRRQRAAKLDGHTLCSKCEYPLDLREGPAVCPECGCKRTEIEHEAASKDWRFWK